MLGQIKSLGTLFYLVPLRVGYDELKDVPEYITEAVPFFILLITIEFVYSKFLNLKIYKLKDLLMSFSLGMVQQMVSLVYKPFTFLPYIALYKFFQPIRQSYLPSSLIIDKIVDSEEAKQSQLFLYFIVGMIGCDLSYYWLHRYAHELHALWGSHSIHHSGERYNFATALRQGSVQAAYGWFFYLPWAIIGLPPSQYFRHDQLNTLFQFWVHTEIVGRLPPLIELIFNTPSHHRLHHRPPGNCNYGGLFIIWDRLFGTLATEVNVAAVSNPEWKKKILTNLENETKLIIQNEDSSSPASSTPVQSKNKKSDEDKIDQILHADYPRGVIYGLGDSLNTYNPLYANILHYIRISKSYFESSINKKNEDEKKNFGFYEFLSCFSVMFFKRRVKQPHQLIISPKKFAYDVFYDWKFLLASTKELSPNFLTRIYYYFYLIYKRFLRLPPAYSFDPSLISDDQKKEIKDSSNIKRNEDTLYLTNRDKIFLESREQREKSKKKENTFLIVSHFITMLGVTYGLLLFHSKFSFHINLILLVASITMQYTLQFHY